MNKRQRKKADKQIKSPPLHQEILNWAREFRKEHPLQYVLDAQGNAMPEPDILKWALWFEKDAEATMRRIGNDKVGEALVSTVFLGFDHGLGCFSGGPPILWETMVFDGPHDRLCERYTSREEALAGHARAVAMCRGEITVTDGAITFQGGE